MSWKNAKSLEDARQEFLHRWMEEGECVSVLCREYGISRKTAYKWKKRNLSGESLKDKSRRPKNSPTAISDDIVSKVVAMRTEHPILGGRKISIILKRKGIENVPSGSTITNIIRRNNLLNDRSVAEAKHLVRFAKNAPNEMWQADFKGHFQ